MNTIAVRNLKDVWKECPNCHRQQLVLDWHEYAMRLERHIEVVNEHLVKLTAERDQLRAELDATAAYNVSLKAELTGKLAAAREELAALKKPKPVPLCPRCNTADHLDVFFHRLKVAGYYIECSECMVDSGPHKTLEDAIDAWRPK